jgi:hypothetical protein
MSWFTSTIRDPIEAAIGLGQPAAPTSANKPPTTIKNGITSSPYFTPMVIVGFLIVVVFFFKKG